MNKKDFFINWKSFYKGIITADDPMFWFDLRYWWIRFKCRGLIWCHLWTPQWHKGRGPYVGVKFVFIEIYRGY